MIVTSDLRAAIRSAEKVQPNRHGTDWELKRLRIKRAISAVISKPGIKEKVDEAVKKTEAAEQLNREAGEVFNSLGVSNKLDQIYNDEKFIAAGGILPAGDAKPWKFDAVVAQLAAAKTEKEGVKILARYGIIWTRTP